MGMFTAKIKSVISYDEKFEAFKNEFHCSRTDELDDIEYQ